MVCFAPLLLVGYALTIETSWHQSYNADAPYVQLQTCEVGWGAHGKLSALPWGTAGLHYGLTWSPATDVELIAQPQLGLSYANQIHPNGYRQISRFEVGLAVMARYRQLQMSLEYTHLSNGEFGSRSNVGLDLIGLQTGWKF